MKEKEVFDRLCVRDKRNPMFQDIYSDCKEDELSKPGEDCYCDNCFYGRDKLALEILKEREKSKELLEACKAIRDAMLKIQGFMPNFLEQAIVKAEGR